MSYWERLKRVAELAKRSPEEVDKIIILNGAQKGNFLDVLAQLEKEVGL